MRLGLLLLNEITRDKLKLISDEKFNIAVLYLTLNHTRFYDYFGSVNILIDDFFIIIKPFLILKTYAYPPLLIYHGVSSPKRKGAAFIKISQSH